MTTAQMQALIVFQDELMDAPVVREESPTAIGMLREAFKALQNTDSARWRVEGGWAADCAEFNFGPSIYAVADFYGLGPNLTRFLSGSQEIFDFYDEDWSLEAGKWTKDSPKIWDETHWSPAYGQVHVLLVSALYFASDDDVSVASSAEGETTLKIDLHDSITPDADWFRSVTLTGRVRIEDESLKIVGYSMDWQFDVVSSRSCGRYKILAYQGEYGVQIDVPDDVYFGTTRDLRNAIDRISGPRCPIEIVEDVLFAVRERRCPGHPSEIIEFLALSDE